MLIVLYEMCVMTTLIYMLCQNHLGSIYAIKQKKQKKIILCRVQRPKHTAKNGHGPAWKTSLSCAKSMAHGKGSILCRVLWYLAHGKPPLFAVCRGAGTRQSGPAAVSCRSRLFFLPSVELCTRQKLCRMPDKKSTTKKAFADAWLPWDFGRVLHMAKPLPCANRALPCVFGTRQIACVP